MNHSIIAMYLLRKKTPKCPRLKKALIVAFLLGFSPDHGKITHLSWVFPASLRSLRSPWFPVVPRWFPGSAAAAASTNASRRTRASCRVAKTRRDNMISVVRWRIYLCVCRVIYICVLICSYTIYCIYIYITYP